MPADKLSSTERGSNAASDQPPSASQPSATTVAKASGIMMFALLLSRVLGQVRETVISAQFGQNNATDVYRSAFALPDVLFFLVAGGAFSSAFIPVFTSYLAKGEDEEAWKVFSIVASTLFLVVSAFVIVCEIFAFPLVRMLRPGFTYELVAQTTVLTRIVLPTQIAFFLGSLMFATLYARQLFWVPAMGGNLYNLGTILGGIVIGGLFGAGIVGLAIGAFVGAVVGNLIMPIAVLKKMKAHYRWNMNVKHPGVQQVWKLMIPVIFGLSLPAIYPFVNSWYASKFGEGAISALDQANRLMQAPLGIFGQSLAIAVFPTLTMLAAKNDMNAFRETVNRSLRQVLFINIPVSLLMILYSTEIVTLLLRYGKFNAANVADTARPLALYCLGVFAWSALGIAQRAFYALHDTLTPILLGTFITLIFVPLCGLLSLRFQVQGLPMATSVVAVLLMSLMILFLARRIKGIQGERLLRSLTGTLIATGALGLAGWLTRSGMVKLAASLGLDPRLSALFVLALSGGLSLLAFLSVALALKMEELDFALKRFKRKRAPSR